MNKKEENELNIKIRYNKTKKRQTYKPAAPEFLPDLKNLTDFSGRP